MYMFIYSLTDNCSFSCIFSTCYQPVIFFYWLATDMSDDSTFQSIGAATNKLYYLYGYIFILFFVQPPTGVRSVIAPTFWEQTHYRRYLFTNYF